MRTIVVNLVQGLGLRHVRQAANGQEALALLKAQPCDMALVDLNMDPVDGVAFTREVRNSPDSPDIYLPVIMMTGNVDRARVEAARDAGVNEFILKPLTLTALVGRMEAVIQRPRPFTRTIEYFGPDRRRRSDPVYLGPFRRAGDRGEVAPSAVWEI